MLYGLIGEKLGHSYSCAIHAAIADYDYELKELAPDELEEFFLKREFLGINVTIPYKRVVFNWLDEVSPEAKRIGAVNTVVNRNGKLYGYNTDIMGMEALARRVGLEFAGKKLLILGTGGTSATAMALARRLGAGEVYRVSRTAKENSLSYEQAYSLHRDADIIINATPSGMFPENDGCPIESDRFTKLEGLLDAVYNPLRTRLVIQAQERGIKAEGGLYMLAAQAVYASALFRDTPVRQSDIRTAFDAVNNSVCNTVLIGMPGSGKTSIGKYLARKSGRAFADSDSIITDRIGMPIADFFSKYGEAAFRDIESEAIKQLSAPGGKIIATGGGAILRKENVTALKHNGRLFFLDRSPEKLIPTSDRPLSSDREAMLKRYSERYDKYLAAADTVIDANGSIEETAEKI